MRHRTFLAYRQYRYLKASVLVVVVTTLIYFSTQFPLGHYGGTGLGYVLGTIAAGLIVWLMWLGIQKRRYAANNGDLKGWLSAHVYLGTTLIVIATLHTGFQVGLNVHTLAYVLMLLVIFSGFFGVYAYTRYPALITKNLGEDTLTSLLMKIADTDKQIKVLALSASDEINRHAMRAVTDTRIGGGVIAQFRHRPRNCPTRLAAEYLEEGGRSLKSSELHLNRELFALMLHKQKLVDAARSDIRYKAMLDVWLYFHVPASCALLAALTAHVVSVFFYW